MDSHTFLVNKALGLSISWPNTKWPSALLELGYKIHGIEHTVNVRGRNVSPDIILTSSKARHALVIDCKSGANIDREQDAMYRQVTVNSLHKSGVPDFVNSHTAVYAINEEHVDRIQSHTEHALVVFGNRTIYGIRNFGDAQLARVLDRGVPIESGSFPNTDVYPFSVRDTHGYIDRRVSKAILGYVYRSLNMAGRSLATRADAGAVLRTAHPLHALFSGPHRRELRRAVEQSIARQEEGGAWWLGPAGRGAMGP